jgi:hypothetical protein
LIVEAHIVGHRGVEKTKLAVEDAGFTWVGIDGDATQVVQRCLVCQRDGERGATYHMARAIVMPGEVFERVHMDLLELLPSEGPVESMKYVLLIVDALSKYPIGIPLPNKEMLTVAEALWRTITVFGAPKTLLSDNGAEFVNEVVETLTSVHGIDRRVVTAYRPQANGQVERFNRSLLAILRKCTGESPRRWVEWLDFALMAIRTTVHSATGFTPHELMFGRPHHPMSHDYARAGVCWRGRKRIVMGRQRQLGWGGWRHTCGGVRRYGERDVSKGQRRRRDSARFKMVEVAWWRKGWCRARGCCCAKNIGSIN